MITTGSAMRRTLLIAAACLPLACSSELPTDPADVEMRAARGGATGGSTGGLVVSSAVPGAATRDTTLDVRILGSGFARGMTARWAIDSVVTSHVVVNSTRFISSTELVANISIKSDAQLTDYDIIVTSTKGGKPGIGTEIFDVVQEVMLASLGGAYSSATDINESGQIVGYSSLSSAAGSTADHPVIWEADGTIRDLLPPGYIMGRAVAINENGEVAGWLGGGPSGGITPFVWSASAGMRFLPTLPGEDQHGAFTINDAGVVGGWSGRSAVVWENGVLRVVHHDPNQWSAVTDVNNLGEIAGYYEPVFNGESNTAWTWSAASGIRLLPTLQGSSGMARAINDRGQIVGFGPSAAGGASGFIHEDGVTRELTEAIIGVHRAFGISEMGHVVGVTSDSRGIMREPDGTFSIICSPVPPAKGYTSSCGTYAVNAKGVMVGMKTDKFGRTVAHKWSQVVF